MRHVLDRWARCDRGKIQSGFPTVQKVQDRRRILEDPNIDMILISAVPSDRAAMAIEAMEAGKDVMVDKPGAQPWSSWQRLRRHKKEQDAFGPSIFRTVLRCAP